MIGRKVGMTRVFTEAGDSLPVTVIQVEPNRITQVRTEDRDGYCAVQVTVGTQLPSRVNKPESGHLAKANVEPGRGLWEIRLAPDDLGELEPGGEINVSQLDGAERVDVTGTTIGKGFAGTIKRHNFRGQRNSHGNSLSHRVPGSIGQNQTPGRVFKGKKMSGHMGNVQRTTQNLRVVRVDSERNLLLVMGAVPGPKGGNLIVRPAGKTRT
jgi:large subunit ribosomal protein L3